MFLKRHYKTVCILLVLAAAAVALLSKVTFVNRNGLEGIYLLKGVKGDWLEVTDDLSPDDMGRLLWSTPTPSLKRARVSGACVPNDVDPCTSFEWNEGIGRGFIKTIYPGNRKLIITLGRYIGTTTGKPVSGLFIGGGLPTGDPDYLHGESNESGITYFDGNRYYHIWCTVNEGIQDADNKGILPSTWEFVSSKVLEDSDIGLTITSKHRTMVNNVPVGIERTLFYQTGDMFVTMVTKLTNIGKIPTFFRYIYGDEPWLGNFYTYSKGDIGWFEGGLITTEMLIDTSKHNYIGMFDYGNQLAGESHSFTGKANFIEWEPATRPDIAYFSNQLGTVAPPEQKVPLTSYKNRVVSMEWGPKKFHPGQSLTFTLKVGMADIDSKTGLPVKPDTQLY